MRDAVRIVGRALAGLALGILVPRLQAETPATGTGPAPIVIERKGGPPTIPDVPRDQVIGFALYTVDRGILKLSAQLYPLTPGEPREVALQLRRDGGWETIARAPVDETGWLATFRIENWDAGRDRPYRVTHPGGAVFEGLIRRDPVERDEIVVAAFT
ncbi:MAG: hypothetical protein HY718_21455, partial [Planctomycetes bacterium]|nr:hypothetical protein [Planctomycetota bacterium]